MQSDWIVTHEKKSISKQSDQRNFYRNSLKVDSGKAEIVMQLQNNYKKELNAIMGDTTLKDVGTGMAAITMGT